MTSLNLFNHGRAIHFSKSLTVVNQSRPVGILNISPSIWIKSITITNNATDTENRITDTIYVYQKLNFDPSNFLDRSDDRVRSSYPTNIEVIIAPSYDFFNANLDVSFIEGQPGRENNAISIAVDERFGADVQATLFGDTPVPEERGTYSIEVKDKIDASGWRSALKRTDGYARNFGEWHPKDFRYSFQNPAIFNHDRDNVGIDVNLLGNGALADPRSGPVKLAHLGVWRVKRDPSKTGPVTTFQTGIYVSFTHSWLDPQFLGDEAKHETAHGFAGVFEWNYDGDIK